MARIRFDSAWFLDTNVRSLSSDHQVVLFGALGIALANDDRGRLDVADYAELAERIMLPRAVVIDALTAIDAIFGDVVGRRRNGRLMIDLRLFLEPPGGFEWKSPESVAARQRASRERRKADVTRDTVTRHSVTRDSVTHVTEENVTRHSVTRDSVTDPETPRESQRLRGNSDEIPRVRARDVKSPSSLSNKLLISDDGDRRLQEECSYETEFGSDELALLTARWVAINPVFDEAWLRRSLRLAHTSYGPLPKSVVGGVLKAVRERLKGKLAITDPGNPAFVTDPDRYATKVFLEKMKEQAHVRPAG